MDELSLGATVAERFSAGQPQTCRNASAPRPERRANTPGRRPLAWLAALVGLACASCRGTPEWRPSGYVVVGLEAAPLSCDPRLATDANSELVTRLVYQGLVALSPSGEVTAELANHWESPDPLTYRFTLGAARFHDGEPVTARDVVATYRSLESPLLHAPRQEGLRFVREIVAEDEHTVRFTLGQPYSAFLQAMTLGILPARCAEVAECGVGSGPFRLEERDVDHVVLGRAPTANPQPRLPGVVFRVAPDSVVRALELARGSIDLAENAVDPEAVDWLARQGLEVIAVPGSNFQYLGLNLRVPPLGDPRVRQAIALAIDRQAIIAHLLRGYARLADELLPPEHWAYAPEVASYPYAPERARALLEDAGLHLRGDPSRPGPRFRLVYKTSTVELRRRVAEAIAAFLGDVGIAVEIRSLEWATLYEDIRRSNFELFSLSWVGVSDPDHYYSILHSTMTPPQGNNRGGYASPLVDELTVAGRHAADREGRSAIYRRVAARAAEDLPYVPLWWASNVVVKTRRLAGFVASPTGDLRGLAAAYWRDPGSPG